MALVNVLIPAYKKEFLARAIFSASHQTIRETSILVADDSPGDGATSEVRASLSGPGMRFFTGPKQGADANIEFLLGQLDADCEYVHILMDDDVVFPTFLQEHVRSLRFNPDSHCSVSSRWLIDEQDRIHDIFPVPDVIAGNPGKRLAIGRDSLFASVIPRNYNWLGEFSNTVWKRGFAQTLPGRTSHGISFLGLGDIGQILLAGMEAPVVYINEYLGAFRVHGEQTSRAKDSPWMVAAHLAWGALGQIGLRCGALTAEQADQCLRTVDEGMRATYVEDAARLALFRYDPAMAPADRQASFDSCWREFLRENFRTDVQRRP